MKSKKVTIVLNDGAADLSQKWTDIIRVGDWKESYKEFQIKKSDLDHMVKNFSDNVLNLDKGELQFNYSHQSYAEAAGWIEDLRIENGTLQAKVRWTPKAQERIEGEEFKYVSAELDFSYRDEESGERYGITLTGAALTNIPFVRGMKAVALSNDQNEETTLLFSNPLPKMEKFKELLSTLQGNKNVSLAEVAVLNGALAMLSDAEQAEVKTEVEALSELAAGNDAASKEAAQTAKKELADAQAAAELAGKGADAQVQTLSTNLDAAQAQISSQQKELDQMKHAARKSDLESSVQSLCDSGKVLPKDSASTVELLLDMSPEKATKWLSHLDGMPARVVLGEQGAAEANEKELADGFSISDADAKKLAQERFEKNPELSLADHLGNVYSEHAA